MEERSRGKRDLGLPCESWQRQMGAWAKVVMWRFKEVDGFETCWEVKSIGLGGLK